jgi:hypothetical protein
MLLSQGRTNLIFWQQLNIIGCEFLIVYSDFLLTSNCHFLMTYVVYLLPGGLISKDRKTLNVGAVSIYCQAMITI